MKSVATEGQLAVNFTFACLMFLTAGVVRAGTINVPGDFPTIQAAIDTASAGDTVLVAPGTYVENIDFLGKLITVKGSGGPYVTTIDGGGNGSVVTFSSYEDTNSVLDGFTITNGSGYYDTSGGGIYCTDSSPSIKNNVIENNQTWEGGGIYCAGYGSHPLIRDNIIRNNTAFDRGGGIDCEADSAVILNNVIENNDGGSDPYSWGGGGIFVGMSFNPTITGNVIRGNRTDADGGGINILETSPIIVNNVISGNSALQNGGGIHIQWSSFLPAITNNTITLNSATAGGGIYIDPSTPNSFPVTNTIIWRNSALISPEIADSAGMATVTYCDVEGGWPGLGNINVDPLFADSTSGDFHLTAGSLCIGNGTVSAPNLPDVDFEGDPRVAYGTVDIGADEGYPHLYHVGAVVPGQMFDIRVIGFPNALVYLGYSENLLSQPDTTIYGELYLGPPLSVFFLGTVQSNGFFSITFQVPVWWLPGEEYYLQALIGNMLTNLDILKVE